MKLRILQDQLPTKTGLEWTCTTPKELKLGFSNIVDVFKNFLGVV